MKLNGYVFLCLEVPNMNLIDFSQPVKKFICGFFNLSHLIKYRTYKFKLCDLNLQKSSKFNKIEAQEPSISKKLNLSLTLKQLSL